MNPLYIVLIVIAIYIAYNWYSTRNIKHITTADLRGLLKDKNNYQFVDVRTPGEFKSNKIKGFINIPVDQIHSQLEKLSQDKAVVVICQSGSRSSRAAKVLIKSGYKNVINVRGGMSTWRG